MSLDPWLVKHYKRRAESRRRSRRIRSKERLRVGQPIVCLIHGEGPFEARITDVGENVFHATTRDGKRVVATLGTEGTKWVRGWQPKTVECFLAMLAAKALTA